MSIEILYEQIMHAGDRACKITSITGVLEYDKLPYEYTYHRPYMYMEGERLLMLPTEGSDVRNAYDLGDIISPEDMQLLISEMTACVNRLAKINKRIRNDALGLERIFVRVFI